MILGVTTESSLDNFFSSSTNAQHHFESRAGSEPESEANVGRKTGIVEDEKPRKCKYKKVKKYCSENRNLIFRWLTRFVLLTQFFFL